MTVMNPEELIGEGAVRDPDLVAKLKEAQGRGGYAFMVKHCVLEQEARDRQTLLPRDKRRRAQTRTKLDLEGNNVMTYVTSTACLRFAACHTLANPLKFVNTNAHKAE